MGTPSSDAITNGYGRPVSDVAVIRSDEEAVAAATTYASYLGEQAATRDRDRVLPHEELAAYARSGLGGVRVPRTYGGAEVSFETLAKILILVGEGDSSIAHIIINNYYVSQLLSAVGTEGQKEKYFGLLLNGARFGNASSEVGTARAEVLDTRLLESNEGLRLNGKKFYSTGALISDFIFAIANNAAGDAVAVLLETGTPGYSVIDDWDGIGQRTTASGTVVLDNVAVTPDQVLPSKRAQEIAPLGSIAQLGHGALDLGIAKGAFKDTLNYVRSHTRPWRGTGIERAVEDPFILGEIGDLSARIEASEQLLHHAGRTIDAAVAESTPENLARAAVATAQAKILSTEAALQTTNKLFQLGGASTSLTKYGFDRHWRNARIHTVHDPLHWKPYFIGNYYLNNAFPPRGGAL